MLTTATHTTARRKGFAVPCIRCGEADACVRLDLNDLSDGSTAIRCDACEQEYSLADVREVLDAWTTALAWIDTATALLNDE